MPLITQLDAKIWLAIKVRLDTFPGGYPVIDPGQTYPTNAGQAFILAQDVRFDPVVQYAGNASPDEHRGQIALAVMTPLEWSHAQTLGLAGAVRAHFPKGAKYIYQDCTVQILNTPYTETAYRDGPFNRLPVIIRWRCAG
jgi:hypothetical protein